MVRTHILQAQNLRLHLFQGPTGGGHSHIGQDYLGGLVVLGSRRLQRLRATSSLSMAPTEWTHKQLGSARCPFTWDHMGLTMVIFFLDKSAGVCFIVVFLRLACALCAFSFSVVQPFADFGSVGSLLPAPCADFVVRFRNRVWALGLCDCSDCSCLGAVRTLTETI